MRCSRLNYGPLHLELHPSLTLVTGLDPRAAAVLARDLALLGANKPPFGIDAEIENGDHGVVHVIDPADFERIPERLCDLFRLARHDPDEIIRAAYVLDEAEDAAEGLDASPEAVDVATPRPVRDPFFVVGVLTAAATALLVIDEPRWAISMIISALGIVIMQMVRSARAEADASTRPDDRQTLDDQARARECWSDLLGDMSTEWALGALPDAAPLRTFAAQVSAQGQDDDLAVLALAYHLSFARPEDIVVLHETLAGIGVSDKVQLLDSMTETFRAQVVILSSDEDAVSWARLEAAAGTVALVEPSRV